MWPKPKRKTDKRNRLTGDPDNGVFRHRLKNHHHLYFKNIKDKMENVNREPETTIIIQKKFTELKLSGP